MKIIIKIMYNNVLPFIQKSTVQIFIQMVENILTNVENIALLYINICPDSPPILQGLFVGCIYVGSGDPVRVLRLLHNEYAGYN